MHELSLAFELVDKATEIATRENVKKVASVVVKIGPDSGVDAEAFAFAFPEATRDTLLSEAKLIVETGIGREFQFVNMEVQDV